jgi:hypothetical protein
VLSDVGVQDILECGSNIERIGLCGRATSVSQAGRRDGRLFLCPANSHYNEIELDEEAQIFGRDTHSITHHLRIKQHLPAVG